MEESKSNAQHLNDASDDCTHSIPAVDNRNAPPPEKSIRRRRSIRDWATKKLKTAKGNHIVIDEKSTNLDSIKGVNEEKSELSRSLMRNQEIIDEKSMNLDSNKGVKEEKLDLSMIENKKVEEISNVEENEDLNTRGLFSSVNMMIKAIRSMISVVTYPVWLIYSVYMFFTDPFGIVKRVKSYVVGKVMRICWEWLKEQGYVWKVGMKFGWGVLWAGYVSIILVGLLFVAFMAGGVVVKGFVEEPLRVKETLNFDYTEKSPVAYVPLAVMGGRWGEYKENVEEVGGGRVIPPNHKLQVTVSMNLPESDYNRNLGNFQARVDLLSAEGMTLASSRQVCILQFKSNIIRVVLTFLNVAPLVTGCASESQKLNIKFRGFTEGIRPTAYLRVIIEQRAEFQPGGGIPEIYDASLALESELPLLKRVIWYWKKTLYVWISLTLFTVELFSALLCCRPLLLPRIKLRETSASRNAPGASPPAKVHMQPSPHSNKSWLA